MKKIKRIVFGWELFLFFFRRWRQAVASSDSRHFKSFFNTLGTLLWQQ